MYSQSHTATGPGPIVSTGVFGAKQPVIASVKLVFENKKELEIKC